MKQHYKPKDPRLVRAEAAFDLLTIASVVVLSVLSFISFYRWWTS